MNADNYQSHFAKYRLSSRSLLELGHSRMRSGLGSLADGIILAGPHFPKYHRSFHFQAEFPIFANRKEDTKRGGHDVCEHPLQELIDSVKK
jgi:hypothetical protein